MRRRSEPRSEQQLVGFGAGAGAGTGTSEAKRDEQDGTATESG
jgi:hypothetical protein